jgi:hypothetical protein
LAEVEVKVTVTVPEVVTEFKAIVELLLEQAGRSMAPLGDAVKAQRRDTEPE